MAARKNAERKATGRGGTKKPRGRKKSRVRQSTPRAANGKSPAERAVKALEAKYRQFRESVLDPFVCLDMAGCLMDFNTPFATMLGYDPEELLRLTNTGLTPEKWHAAETGILERQVTARGYSDIYEKEYRRKDGTTIPVELRAVLLRDEEDHPSGMCLHIRDITSRKQLEDRLRLTEEKFTKAFHLSPDAVNLNRMSDGVYLAINEGFTRTTGYTPADVLGRSSLPGDLGLWVHREDREKLVAGLREHGVVEELEAEFRMKNGNVRTGLLSARIIHLDNEPCILSVTRDITERKRAEDAIVRSLREKEVLLKEVHHRVKNNLQIISSMLNMQASEVDNEIVSTALNEAQSRVRSMALVHERLYGVTDFANIDLCDYARSLTANLARTWMRPGISVEVQGGQTLVGVDIAIPCGLILNELVTNALKHAFVGRESGRVVVAVQRRNSGEVEMKVQDDGIGFPGGRDFSTMTSMGMNLVVNLVEQLSGTIALERSHGCSFVMLFRP